MFLGRQLMFSKLPLSYLVETYLYDNEGRPQKLDKFPMLKFIYDQMPERLLLKCSRKALKSTLVSNIIALNMVRWNNYKGLYVTPDEKRAKYFSTNYLPPRFSSPKFKQLLPRGLSKNDVFEKILDTTNSSLLITYASDDASRTRGPAVDYIVADEVQSMAYDIFPIITETAALSDYKRHVYAGTPLTSDNSIERLWVHSQAHEWFTKCEHCNHWNAIIEENNPIKMCKAHGLCCSKCEQLLNTVNGEWVVIRNQGADLKGFHLAQPMIPFYNQTPKQWKDVYGKVQKIESGEIELYQVYNEVFGLSYDVGSKPITLHELKELAILGSQMGENGEMRIFEAKQRRYKKVAVGVDWGVSGITSRTSILGGGLLQDGTIEIFFSRILKTSDYKEHINTAADLSKKVKSFTLSDSGPDPIRGIELAEAYNTELCFLAQYANIPMIQNYKVSSSGRWQDARIQLHKSDCFSLVFRLLKHKKILFPRYEEVQEGFNDILNEFIETSNVGLNQRLIYTHPDTAPDDYLHSLCYVVMQLLISTDDPRVQGPSTSNTDMDIVGY